ncbi:MAG: hypothetical protein M0Q94_13480 [Candidatus Cloacimonetes bacterium]|nr:hypothetical protein [Candidatus Cloacimonadota bacterium]
MDQIVITIKRIGLIAVLIGALTILSSSITDLAVWTWLTKIFILFRNSLSLIDFIIDTKTLMVIIGLTFTIDIALWSYKSFTWVAKKFNE